MILMDEVNLLHPSFLFVICIIRFSTDGVLKRYGLSKKKDKMLIKGSLYFE